jgi:hypothetical protein
MRLREISALKSASKDANAIKPRRSSANNKNSQTGARLTAHRKIPPHIPLAKPVRCNAHRRRGKTVAYPFR